MTCHRQTMEITPAAVRQGVRSETGSGSGRSRFVYWAGRRLVTMVCLAVSLGGLGLAYADSARALVRRGNEAYEQGKWREAMAAYEEADVEAPESPVIRFNQGAAYYRMDDLKAAREAFEEAAAAASDPAFEAKSRYNIGNCWFQEARRQLDSNPQKALEACEKAIDSYRSAAALDGQLEQAKRNIEVARKLWKSIVDQQKQRQEQQKQQQQTGENESREKKQDQSAENQDSQKGKQDGKKQQQKTSEQGEQQAAQQKQGEQKESDSPEQAMMLDEDARDILDEEKKNRDRRRGRRQNGIRPVEKDW